MQIFLWEAYSIKRKQCLNWMYIIGEMHIWGDVYSVHVHLSEWSFKMQPIWCRIRNRLLITIIKLVQILQHWQNCWEMFSRIVGKSVPNYAWRSQLNSLCDKSTIAFNKFKNWGQKAVENNGSDALQHLLCSSLEKCRRPFAGDIILADASLHSYV